MFLKYLVWGFSEYSSGEVQVCIQFLERGGGLKERDFEVNSFSGVVEEEIAHD